MRHNNLKYETCKGCTKRQLHCHSTCESYLKFVEENEKRRNFMREQLKINDIIFAAAGRRNKSLTEQKAAGTKHKSHRHCER